MKNHYLISPLILTTLVLLATGCQKEKLDYPELVDGATFNQFIPELATSVVFEYNNDYKGTHILSTFRQHRMACHHLGQHHLRQSPLW